MAAGKITTTHGGIRAEKTVTIHNTGVWCLLGKKSGDNAQVLTLARALGLEYTEKQVLARSWELLVHTQHRPTLMGIDKARSSPLQAPWPALVISAGRRNEAVARWIRQQSGGRTRLVHIGRPWAPLNEWDLIVSTPQYFLPPEPHILVNTLPLHTPVPGPEVRNGEFLDETGGLPAPRIAVLVGGDSGPFVMTAAKATALAQRSSAVACAVGGSLLVIDSPRTPAVAQQALAAGLTAPHRYYRWGEAASNPYREILDLADAFVVTGESMSMLADASVTDKPLFIFDLADGPGRWWLKAHNFRRKPLSHRIAMRYGPLRMRRDVGVIQQVLVESGQARWLQAEAQVNAEQLRAALARKAESAAAQADEGSLAPARLASAELARTAEAVKRLLPDR